MFHELRHTFGTHAVRKLDGYAVQSYMGHAHYSTTQRYLHHKPVARTRRSWPTRSSPQPSPEPRQFQTN